MSIGLFFEMPSGSRVSRSGTGSALLLLDNGSICFKVRQNGSIIEPMDRLLAILAGGLICLICAVIWSERKAYDLEPDQGQKHE